MTENVTRVLEKGPLESSAPCRIDMGGTLDIKTIYLPMASLSPVTFNVAIDLRTEVKLLPYKKGIVKVSSRGFDAVEFPADEAPYDHPLGLMFAIAAHYNISGLHIDINSASPPKSALGGSSAAAVALVSALEALPATPVNMSRKEIALTAHAVEEGVARVSCGLQDQLAAVYGGANAWAWEFRAGQLDFKREIVFDKSQCRDFNKRFIIAYCGIPHESRDINGRWLDHFIRGQNRGVWKEIMACSRSFIEALAADQIDKAVRLMNRECALRKQMTPDVFDDMGDCLSACAREMDCGARFTGAGGGGCVWALGDPGKIRQLKKEWLVLLQRREEAFLLETRVDTQGVIAPARVPLND